MNGELTMHLTCPVCAYETRGMAWASIKPGMRQARFTVDLSYMNNRCAECRHPIGRLNNSGVRYRVHPETAARLTAWRDRQRARRKKAA